MIRKMCTVLLASALVSPATAAVVVTGATPSSFNVVYNGNVALTNQPGLTAAMTFNFLNVSNAGKTYNFSYALTNTSSGAITASRVSGFGVNTTPNIVSAVAGGPTFTQTHIPGSFPNGVGAFELCVNDANSCQGGGNGGVTKGNTGAGSFSLTFANAQSQIAFDNFYVRYQSIAGTNLGTSGTGIGMVPPAVPEPATWALMIGGFGAIGGTMRYRRREATTQARA